MTSDISKIGDGWEIVSRRSHNQINLLFMLLQIAFMLPEAMPYYTAVTYTVRRPATGAVRKVTARSEQELGEKIALGLFDEDA